jgi:hypothetical protein
MIINQITELKIIAYQTGKDIKRLRERKKEMYSSAA